MISVDVILLVLGALGHLILWPAWVNRVHSWALPRWIIHALTILAGVVGGVVPLWIAADYYVMGWTGWPISLGRYLLLGYLAICAGVAVASTLENILHCRLRNQEKVLAENLTTVLDLAVAIGHRPMAWGMPNLLSRIPGNQVLQLAIQEKQIRISRLPANWIGIRIAHLSDLHISGRIERPYFDEVVAQTNRLRPDLIAITGDLFDRNGCMDWGVQALAALNAPLGVYFVLGNHDLLVDHEHARELLQEAGMRYLGGQVRWIEYRGQPVVLVGNELPWFTPAADVRELAPRDGSGQPLKIALSHAPDQISWAVAADIDLLLCGHTHGGQICLPFIGAVASPSRYGTRYVGGVYQVGSTLMHVSRGTACLTPFRWNCPPELAILELHAAP